MNYGNKIYLLIIAFAFFDASKIIAQTFPFSSGIVPLCDTVTFTATVSGVNVLQPPGPGPGATLTGILVNITSNHPQTLKVTLTSPDGTDLLLAEYLGAGGSNYSLTNFVYWAAPSITTGMPPFTGNFLAEGGSFSAFDGEDPNGPWVITIIDTACFNIPPGGTGGGPWTPSYFNGSASADGGIGFGGGAAPLPISLLHLEAQQNNKHVQVDWTTESEVNNYYFDVERTIDLINYKHIGRIEGHGSTTSAHHYTVTDTDPVNGVQYYRLKQTDFDGRYAYFGPVVLNFKSENDFEIITTYKSSNGNIQLVYNSGGAYNISCTVHDMYGRMVSFSNNIKSNQGPNQLSLDVELAPGIYTITLNNGLESTSKKILY